MTQNPTHICPVCGFDGLAKAAYDKRGFGSLEVCPSCAFQFNVSDTQYGWSFRDWRARWISDGMQWSSLNLKRPRGWNAQNQLGRLRLPKSN